MTKKVFKYINLIIDYCTYNFKIFPSYFTIIGSKKYVAKNIFSILSLLLEHKAIFLLKSYTLLQYFVYEFNHCLDQENIGCDLLLGLVSK